MHLPLIAYGQLNRRGSPPKGSKAPGHVGAKEPDRYEDGRLMLVPGAPDIDRCLRRLWATVVSDMGIESSPLRLYALSLRQFLKAPHLSRGAATGQILP